MYEAGIKYLLGLKIENGELYINRCIPPEWKEYSMRYQYGNSIYNIRVTNPNGKMQEISHFRINGVENSEKRITLNKLGGVYNIEVEI